MTYLFKLTGETPAKKNSRIVLKSGKNIPSKAFTSWHESALIQLYAQKRPVNPLKTSLSIYLQFFHGDLRRRDSDNGTSSIMDLLQDALIINDDNWTIVNKIVVMNEYRKNEPGCIVTIIEN